MKKSPDGSAVLDTNIVIAMFAGNPSVFDSLKRFSKLFVPVPVLGELYHGAENSSRVTENIKRVDQFTHSVNTLSCDITTAREYARLKHQLWSKGKPIPENDLWIAAIAAQHNMTVVTREKHFQSVMGIQVAML